MINDECDVINCCEKAVKEIEEEDGENWFVCNLHSVGKITLGN